MNTKTIEKYLLKLKDAFLDETTENKKMLDIYVKYIEGYATNDEIEEANYQLKQVFKKVYIKNQDGIKRRLFRRHSSIHRANHNAQNTRKTKQIHPKSAGS